LPPAAATEGATSEAPRADGERKRRRRRRRGGRGGSGEARPEAALAGVAVAESLLEADEEDEGDDPSAGEAAGTDSSGAPADAEGTARLADTQPLPILALPTEGLAPGSRGSSAETATRVAAETGGVALETAPPTDAAVAPRLPATQTHPHAGTEAAAASAAAQPLAEETPLEELLSAIGTVPSETTAEVPALAAADAEAGAAREADIPAEDEAESDGKRVAATPTADTAETAAGESPAEEAPPPKPTYTVWSSSD
jgi:ribonuclease E